MKMRQNKPLHAQFEKILARGRQSFYWRHCIIKQFVVPYHYHPEFELILICEGRGRRLVGDSIGHFGPGELALIAPHVPHVWMVAPDCPRAETIYVQFRPDFLGMEFFARPEWQAARELMETARRGVGFNPAVREDVAARLKKFPKLDETARLLSLLEILQRMSGDRGAHPLARSPGPARFNRRHEERIDRVFQYLNQKLNGPISQAEIARSVHLSPAAFSRLFKRTTGKCFMEAVNELRIGQVGRLLTETSRSISEIAYECGYETLSHFNRQFRQFMKMTPRQYRRKVGGFGG
jgi:AraC-like DNA-binding protein/quercetin dioxygenase-like cupin family protein